MVFMEAFLFVATGILSTIVGQILLFSGSGDSWTMLIPLSNYFGMALVSFIPERFTLLSTSSANTTSTPQNKEQEGINIITGSTDELLGPSDNITDNNTSSSASLSMNMDTDIYSTSIEDIGVKPRHRTTMNMNTTTNNNISHSNGSTSSVHSTSIPSTPLRSLSNAGSSTTVPHNHHNHTIVTSTLTPNNRGSPTSSSNTNNITNNTNDALIITTTNYNDTNDDIDIRKKQQLPTTNTLSFIKTLHQKLLSLASSSTSTTSSTSGEHTHTVHESHHHHQSELSDSSVSFPPPSKLCGIISRPFSITTQQYIISVIILDILGYYFHILGLRYAGSALFQVIYSSVVIWAAILSRLLRGKQHNNQLNRYQVIGICIVLFGLIYSTVAEHIQPENLSPWLTYLFPSVKSSSSDFVTTTIDTKNAPNHHQGAATIDIEGAGNDKEDTSASLSSISSAATIANATKRWEILLGMIFSLLSSLTYATVYAIAECLMAQPNPPSPKYVAKYIGFGISVVLFIYILFFTLPRYQDILQHVQEIQFISWPTIFFCYFLMMMSAAVHSITYYQLMYSLGAIAAGIMQSARAVGVFIIAGFIFCSYQESQCFTISRGIATLFVIGGILFYSYGKQLHHGHK